MANNQQSEKNKKIGQKINSWANKFFALIIVLIVVIVLALGYFLVLSDQYQQLKKTRNVNLVELDRQVKQLEETTNSLSSYIDQSVSFTTGEEDLISMALPNNFDTASFLVQLENAAKLNKFNVNSLEIKNLKEVENSKAAKSALKKINIDLLVTGSNYEDFKKFLGSLENSVMIFDVMSIDAVSNNTGSLQMKLNMMAYYYSK